MIPNSCKECGRKCKNVSRGSKSCRIKLGLDEEAISSNIDYGTVLLWYYYNQSKKDENKEST
jgi:hypothetical protein